MAYDEELANRIRDVIGKEHQVSEQKMFGGLAFLVGGNMAIAASGQGGILVHVDPQAVRRAHNGHRRLSDGDARTEDEGMAAG